MKSVNNGVFQKTRIGKNFKQAKNDIKKKSKKNPAVLKTHTCKTGTDSLHR